jgi:hypothetical protein
VAVKQWPWRLKFNRAFVLFVFSVAFSDKKRLGHEFKVLVMPALAKKTDLPAMTGQANQQWAQ